MKILIVGNRGGTGIGACFERAAESLSVETQMMEPRLAMEASVWLRRFNWWVRGRRPTRLRSFGRQVVEQCGQWKPKVLLSTGIAPISRSALQEIGSLGIRRLNYLTDDPWNPAHRAPWFFQALPCYDRVFSTRKANLEDLKRLGCTKVSHLPFAYAPDLHFPEGTISPAEGAGFAADLVFVGSADRDRVPYIVSTLRSGVRVRVYGSYWDRFPETKDRQFQGQIDPAAMRKAIGSAKVALCLVRRANRDGNAMRSFEIPAIGTCMLTEDTEEHRELFGEDGEATVYFRTAEEMVERLRWLLSHDSERKRLAGAVHRIVIEGRHTYQDRLRAMLEGEPSRSSHGQDFGAA